MRQKIINLVFAVLLIIVGADFLLGEVFLPADSLDEESVCTVYTGEWERITADGTRETVTMPGKCKAKRNETVIVETTLPENIENDRYLCFRSAKQDIRFWINGELKKEYSTKDNRIFGKMSAVAYLFLKINEEMHRRHSV